MIAEPGLGDRHQEAVDVGDRLLQRHEGLDPERLHPAVVGGLGDDDVVAVVVAADPRHQRRPRPGRRRRAIGPLEQRFGKRDRDHRVAREVDVAHVERALFLQRQAVDAFVLGHEVGEVLGVPGRLAGRDQQVGDVHRQLEGDAHPLGADLGFDFRQGVLERVRRAGPAAACCASSRAAARNECRPTRVFIRQVQSGPQTTSSAGGGPLRAISRVISRCPMPPARPLARRRMISALSGSRRSASSRMPFGHLAAQRRGGALGERPRPRQVCRLRIASLWAASLSSSGITSRGVGRRLAVERHVADAVLVVERPERRQQLRGLATGQLRHLASIPSPPAWLGAMRALSPRFPGEGLSKPPVRAKVPKGTRQMQLGS